MPPTHRLLPIASIIDRISQRHYRKAANYLLRAAGVEIDGSPLWISSQTYFDVGAAGSIKLGDRCVISHGVRILTHDFSLDRAAEFTNGLRADNLEFVRTASVRIGAQAFLGMGAIILPGVNVGDGAIVGAGSVVTRDVNAGTIVAGNPAREIGDVARYVREKSSLFQLAERRR